MKSLGIFPLTLNVCLLSGKKVTADNKGGDVGEEEDNGISNRLHHRRSSSTPDIHAHLIDQQDQQDSEVCDNTSAQKLVKGAKSVCRVVKDFTPEDGDPSCIPLRVSCGVSSLLTDRRQVHISYKEIAHKLILLFVHQITRQLYP